MRDYKCIHNHEPEYYCGKCDCASVPASGSAIRAGFAEEVEQMSNAELKQRVLNQATHIAGYQRCLDGLGFLIGLDEHRRPDDIRMIAEELIAIRMIAEELIARL